MMTAATPGGAVPAKVSASDRAMVAAGLAKDVDDVNQYADLRAGNAAEDGQQQTEGRDRFRQPLPGTAACGRR
jgi:hypothetical protein